MLDFQSQQYKLFSQLANAYAYTFAGINLRNIYFAINSDIMAGNVDSLPEVSPQSHTIIKALDLYKVYQLVNV